MQTLIGLLAVTGMRIGETIRLDRGDVDHRHQLLRVIDSKFGKRGELTLHETTTQALDDYAQLRDRLCPRPSCEAFFISRNGTRLLSQVVHRVFARLVTTVCLEPPPGAAGRARTILGTALLSARSLTGTPPTPRTCRRGCRRCPRIWGTWSRRTPTTT
jgi:integrase